MRRLVIAVQPGAYVVARLDGAEPVPEVLLEPGDGFVSVTRTAAELSIVCSAETVPASTRVEPDWRLLTVCGPLDFALTGIMAALSGELAAAGVSLFAVSTYDTDHLLVKEPDLPRAATALRNAGHDVRGL